VPLSDKKTLGIVDTVVVAFPPADLTDYGIHKIRFFTSLTDDNRRSNDTLSMELYSKAYELGAVTNFQNSGSKFVFDCNHARYRSIFAGTIFSGYKCRTTANSRILRETIL